MLNLLQDVNPADLVAFAREIPEPANFTLTQNVLPNQRINSVKYRIKSATRFRNVAKFRAYDATTPLGRRDVEHSILEGMLPPVGQKLVVGELETILLAIERGQDNQDLVDALYDDVENSVQAIRARLELAAGDLLTDGVFSLVDENGLTLEADFGVTAAYRPTAPILWSNSATATPLTDERTWIAKLRNDGDGEPGRVITSQRVIDFLASSQEYKESFFGRAQSSYPLLTPQQVASVRSTYNLPPVEAYDTKVRVDGTQTRVTPENRYFLLPADSGDLGATQYGITAESLVLSRTGSPRLAREDQPGIVVVAKEEDEPVRVWTKATAVAMPLLYSNTAYISAQVLA